MESSKSKALYITIILLLLVSNGVFIYLYLNKEKEVVTVTETLASTDNERKELEALLKKTEAEMGAQVELYKGRNVQLDSAMEQKNLELQAQADKIRALLRNNSMNAAELRKAQDELDVMRYYAKKYSEQIDSFAVANEILKEDLKVTKTNLNQAKEKIEDLTLDNIRKTNKLNVASKLDVENFTILGIQNRNGGRERETTRAKRVDQVKIQFMIADNVAAEPGDKEVYMRLLSPEGATISTSTSGGGTFDYMGEQALYTQRQRINFKNDQPTLTFYYARGTTEWEKGTYTCQLFCDGFMIGKKTFVLD